MVKTRGILPCRWSCGVGSDDNHFTIGAEAIDERGHGLGARSGGVDDLCAAELLELGGGVEGRGTERSCYCFRLGAPAVEKMGPYRGRHGFDLMAWMNHERGMCRVSGFAGGCAAPGGGGGGGGESRG